MKLRLRDNSIRLRLTRSEVTVVASDGIVTGNTQFANNAVLAFSLRSTSDPACSATLEDQSLNVDVPEDKLSHWAATEQVSIEATQLLGNGESLRILVEKDFACLADRPFEDDSDAFQHPKS